jgi:Neuraminidase (sialidase)
MSPALAWMSQPGKLSWTPLPPIASAPEIHYGFPRIVRAANRDLLVFYRVGKTHASDHSAIALRISKDQGRSWGQEKILYRDPDPNRSAHNPVALLAPGGRILLWISRYRFNPSPSKREHCAWSWSDDHGNTWCEFTQFDPDTTRSSYYMTDAIQTSDGLLACNATFPPTGIGNCFAVMWHSSDRGRTWRVRSQLTRLEENRGDEVALLETTPGVILCLLRTRRQPGSNSYPAGLYSFLSKDGGKTWSERPNLHQQLGLTLQRPFLARLDRNRVLLRGRDIERKEVVAFLSKDNAATFGNKIVLDRYLKDGAYTACIAERNAAFMVYYCDSEGGLPDIRAGRLRVD